ncbi:peptide chain release factor N(5)-glutamine methyltransferase [Marixanthomonas spongiae]|uniref:Release factor glutamine methyltransferase n=1 Tax=Marixanthomonas spongiae TaxID=2174845 RepID=A0A2U0I631_9FLAO|nr:peptide chain release factor N(5)-glutamine methyltransferase [Marixanthomonas spongiae]PVW16524.1 peptide chain release factor N(5)-glutamine methyltransferase [Marixanthomonas spongiae]
MKLKQLKKNVIEALSEIYPSEEIHTFFFILSEKYLNLSRIETTLEAEQKINPRVLQKFETALRRLKNHEPIQYIVGGTEFYGLPFKVNEHTLIPRPETEELVEWIIEGAVSENKPDYRILDIGTGSGCIAVSLAKALPQASVFAMDVSLKALEMAKENARLNEVSVQFFQEDILKTGTLPQQYDVIVSNPPYVRELEKLKMKNNVLNFEPPSALYVSNADPLVFYRTISRLALRYLKPHGKLYFEINEYLSNELMKSLKKEGYPHIDLKKDFRGKDRMLQCRKK